MQAKHRSFLLIVHREVNPFRLKEESKSRTLEHFTAQPIPRSDEFDVVSAHFGELGLPAQEGDNPSLGERLILRKPPVELVQRARQD